MTAPTPNAELAWRVLDEIDAHPESWNQRAWATRSECDTAFCFAGWAVTLSDRTLIWDSRGGRNPGWLSNRDMDEAEFVLDDRAESGQQWLADAAREALGIEFHDSAYLFSGDNDRDELGRLVAKFFGPRPERES